MKVLLIAYALSPSRGSEPAIGWGWASGLSQFHDVTVISRSSNRVEVDSYLAEHPELNLRTKWADTRQHRGVVGGIRNYVLWLRDVKEICRVLVAEERFDVVHFVSYGSISVHVDLWDLGVPFVWGPLGGGQRLNPIFQGILGPMPIEARLRNVRIALLPYLPSVRRTAREAALVLATNEETAEVARSCGGKVALFGDTGLYEDLILSEPPAKEVHTGLKMLWTGRMLYRKGLPLIFHAMRLAGQKNLTLDLVGSGPMESRWRRLVEDLGLDAQVRFHGQVPFAKVFNFYDRADLFVFPSVNDSFGSQLLEAASRGLPILTLGHQGADKLIPKDVAWKVPVDSADNVIRGLADAMMCLSTSGELLHAMSNEAIRFAHTESWPARTKRMTALYESIVQTSPVRSGLN